MSQGTLYVSESPKCIVPVALIKHLSLDINVEQNSVLSFAENVPLKKVPSFIGKDGFKLHEALAINNYCMCALPLLFHCLFVCVDSC